MRYVQLASDFRINSARSLELLVVLVFGASNNIGVKTSTKSRQNEVLLLFISQQFWVPLISKIEPGRPEGGTRGSRKDILVLEKIVTYLSVKLSCMCLYT